MARIVKKVKKVETEIKPIISKQSLDIFMEKDSRGDFKNVGSFKNENTKVAKVIIQKVSRYKELDTQLKLIEQEMKQIRKQLMEELKDKNLDQLFVDIYKVCYSQSVSVSFDSDAFKKKYNNLYEQYKTKCTTSERLVINLGN